jgi:glycosyltransferase involved in cell wall biosynthesis
MDLSLQWHGTPPEHVATLLEALVALPEAETAPDGVVCLCPDATSIAPPAGADGAGLVAFVAGIGRLRQDEGRRQLAASLTAWVDRGAILIAPHHKDASDLAALLGLPADRVRALSAPLPTDRVGAAAPGGRDIVVVEDGITAHQLDVVLRAVALVRRLGGDSRLVVPAATAGHLAQPGSRAGAFDLIGGQDVVAAEDWRAAASTAGALLLLGIEPDHAWTLREALATGVPVVAAAGPALSGHLDAAGAPAYPFGPELTQLADALHAATSAGRGAGVGRAAREAVLAQTAESAARTLLTILVDAATGSAAPTRIPAGPAVSVSSPAGEGLNIGIINPHPSAGGGERFLRKLVGTLAQHPSRPRLTLVCQEDSARNFDAGLEELRALGVAVHQAPASELESVFAAVTPDRDVAYCPWPHLAWPPAVDGPLVCTFHDVNWRHFDVLSPEQKRQLDAQTPAWLERCAAVVHSSQFIADEVAGFFGPDYPAHVIPLTADLGGTPVSEAERTVLRRRHALPQRFVFSPAGRHLHKNYATLVAACRLLRAQGRPVSVVATGAATDISYHGPDLIGLGYVSERDISVLYDLSCGVVQTSLYEAGSWPMIEAMDAERPVACSDIPSVVEQVQRLDLDAQLFDPTDVAAVAEALVTLATGPADAEAIAANAARVRSLEWSAVADSYLSVLQDAAAAGRQHVAAAASGARGT